MAGVENDPNSTGCTITETEYQPLDQRTFSLTAHKARRQQRLPHHSPVLHPSGAVLGCRHCQPPQAIHQVTKLLSHKQPQKTRDRIQSLEGIHLIHCSHLKAMHDRGVLLACPTAARDVTVSGFLLTDSQHGIGRWMVSGPNPLLFPQGPTFRTVPHQLMTVVFSLLTAGNRRN